MAVVFRLPEPAGGITVGYRRDDADERRHPLPAGLPASHVRRFDEATNAAVLAGLDADPKGHTLVPGSPAVLLRGGLAVTIQADGPARADRDLPAAVVGALQDLPRLTRESPPAAVAAVVGALNRLRDGMLPLPADDRLLKLLLFQLHRVELRALRELVS